MGLGRDEEIEIRKPPVFKPGEKVQSIRYVKNDGTYPRKDIGEILVRKGDTGYVRDIGTFLQQFYVYAVEWIEPGTLVGMRAREMISLDKPRLVVVSEPAVSTRKLSIAHSSLLPLAETSRRRSRVLPFGRLARTSLKDSLRISPSPRLSPSVSRASCLFVPLLPMKKSSGV